MTVAAGVLYLLFGLSQYMRRVTPSWDLAIFTQLARQYADLKPPIATIKGADFNLLGDHFSPALAILAVPYGLAPSALTLLVVQSLLFALSVAIITREATRTLGRVSGSCIGAAYALSYGLIQAVAAQFHEIAFAVPLLAYSLAKLRHQEWRAAAMWAAPLVFVKEDLGLTVLVVGVLIAYQGARRTGLLLAGWGVLWFTIATQAVIPRMNPLGWGYSSQIELGRLLTHPWEGVLRLVDEPAKLAALLLFVAVTGVIGIRSPILLVAVPTLLWRLWSDNPAYWGQAYHYDAVLMPIAFVALLDAVPRASFSSYEWLRRYAAVAPAVAVTVAVMNVPRTALMDMATAAFWQSSPRAEQAEDVLRRIPAGATVETDIGLMTSLVSNRTVYYIGNDGNPAPEYVLLDAVDGGWSSDPGDAAQYAEQRHPSTIYHTIYDKQGYRLAVQVAP